jgi:hypothetical protein
MKSRQRKLRSWGKARLLTVRDRLAETATRQASGHYFLAGLMSVAWRAGKSQAWIRDHVYALADRRHELVRYGREAHCVPHGMPHVRSTGAQS